MLFTVTYRSKTGAKADIEIEAASRGECFAHCKARGIVPVSVKEGRSSSRPRAAGTAAPHGGGAKPRGGMPWRAAILAATCLAAGIGAWFWLAAREDARPPAPAPKADKAAKAKVPKAPGRPPEAAPAKATGPEAPPATNAPARAHSSTGRVIRAHSARSGRVMTLADGTVVTNTPRVFFKRDFERAFHVALMPNGMGGALLRQVRSRYTDDQILAMLKERVLPEPGDDATAVAVKERVQSFKEEVLRTIANGATVAEVFDSMTRRKTEDGLLRANALKIRTEALRSDDPEAGRRSIEAANVILEENGLRQVEIPRKLQAEKPAPDGNEDAAAKEGTLNKQDDTENQGEQK